MEFSIESSDGQLLELLRTSEPQSVSQMCDALGVTSTAVRQRLTRLMGQGMIQRQVVRCGRGRPSHRYQLTEKARRQVGSNFADLAIVLWEEIRAVRDQEVRRGLLRRIATALAKNYEGQISGQTTEERMKSFSALFAERRVPITVDASGELPVLTLEDCPYPRLAEEDAGICAVEKMMFAQLFDGDVRLSLCRLNGDSCCQFESAEPCLQ